MVNRTGVSPIRIAVLVDGTPVGSIPAGVWIDQIPAQAIPDAVSARQTRVLLNQDGGLFDQVGV